MSIIEEILKQTPDYTDECGEQIWLTLPVDANENMWKHVVVIQLLPGATSLCFQQDEISAYYILWVGQAELILSEESCKLPRYNPVRVDKQVPHQIRNRSKDEPAVLFLRGLQGPWRPQDRILVPQGV